MLSSYIHQHKFQSIINSNNQKFIKPKKRRKRRKKLQKNINEISSLSCNTTNQVMTFAKTKQYFQHDTRIGQKNTKVKQTSSHSASSPPKILKNFASENEKLYNEVAKKFKPLNPKKFKKTQSYSKAIFKSHAKRKIKIAQKQKLKNKHLSIRTTLSTCNSNPNVKLNSPVPPNKTQCCSCFCQDKEIKCYDNINNEHLNTESNLMRNIKRTSSLASATTATTTFLTNYSDSLPIMEPNLPIIIELLQNHSPSLLLETLLNSTKILGNNEESKRYILKYNKYK